MSNLRQTPVFLERETYRKRRMRDVARALPILGVVLILIPSMWGAGTATSYAVVYIFGIWMFLIGLTAFVSNRVKSASDLQGRR